MKSYKKDQRGITHNLMLTGIAVLVLGAIGFAGFRVYKSKNDISAKAAGWGTYISSSSGWTMSACRNGSSIGKFYIKNPTNSKVEMRLMGNVYMTVSPRSNSAVRSNAGNPWGNGFTYSPAASSGGYVNSLPTC